MHRIIVRLAFAILVLTLAASLFALTKAHFNRATSEKPYLLSLPDLSSPQATLETLMSNGDAALADIITNGVPWSPGPEILRMMDTMNVSDMPAASRELDAALAAAQIRDVLGHLSLPPLSDIPDAAAVKQQNITEWTLPGTPISISKVTSGPRMGQFLFSPQTVAIASQLQQALRGLPYHDGKQSNIYEKWRYLPGPLLLPSVIATLPEPLRTPIMGQALWQWLGLIVLLGVNTIVALQIIAWGIRHDAQDISIFRRYGQLVAALAVVGLSFLTLALSDYGLKLWGGILEALLFGLQLTAITGVGWFTVVAILRIGSLIVRICDLHQSSLDAQLVKVVSTLLSITAGIIACFYAANFVGIPVGPLLAGLGIGGLAVALAVRPTLENVIGGLTLFADRPARVGEYCRFGAESGTVEEIGLRTTKIRRPDDAVVTISNAELAQIRIENLSRRRRFQFESLLRLRYETTTQQLRDIMTGIQSMLQQYPKILEGTDRVHFTAFGDYAFELEVRAYVDVTSGSEFAEEQEDLNFRILAIVREAGAHFAFPSRTTYLARDATPTGIDITTEAPPAEAT
jgi:MscS family membrane protein